MSLIYLVAIFHSSANSMNSLIYCR